MDVQRFPFDVDPRFTPVLAALGVRGPNSAVVLDDDGWHLRFGRWTASTAWDNVAGACVTRDYRWFKAIGPRVSLADRGATFGTNARAGTCVRFHEPIPALAGGRLRHPGITVTVVDPDGLADAVRRRVG